MSRIRSIGIASAILVSRYARSEVDCFAIAGSLYVGHDRRARPRAAPSGSTGSPETTQDDLVISQ